VAEFYEQLLSLSAVHTENDHVILESQDIQLVIHAIPAQVVRSIRHLSAACGPRSNADQAVLSRGQPCRSPSIGVIVGGQVRPAVKEREAPSFVPAMAKTPKATSFSFEKIRSRRFLALAGAE
jgi:hypothetical protein